MLFFAPYYPKACSLSAAWYRTYTSSYERRCDVTERKARKTFISFFKGYRVFPELDLKQFRSMSYN